MELFASAIHPPTRASHLLSNGIRQQFRTGRVTTPEAIMMHVHLPGASADTTACLSWSVIGDIDKGTRAHRIETLFLGAGVDKILGHEERHARDWLDKGEVF
jgi:hypothetical protein